MKIELISEGSKGRFVAMEDTALAGTMTYTMAGESKLIIDHTEVEPGFEGKNVGKQLLMALVDYARTSSIKVLPLCPFAKAMFRKLDEIKDVLV